MCMWRKPPLFIIHVSNWLNGWRRDLDGWWVRARRDTDIDPDLHGFLEESAIVVMHPLDAYHMDHNHDEYHLRMRNLRLH